MQPTSASAAPSRVGMGGRFTSSDQIEGMSGSPFVNLADQWRTGNDPSMTGQQQNANQWLRGAGTPIIFTPLVSMAAASYPAGATFQEETGLQSSVLPTDLQRCVGVYEYCMKITSGANAKQGSVINRFS